MTEDSTDQELDPSLFLEEPTEAQGQEPTPEVTEPEPDPIPEKYVGKSASEIIRMHQDAERLLGRQGNELGDLRKVVNDLVEVTNAKSSPAPEETETDFFTDPKEATRRAVQNTLKEDPEIQGIKQELEYNRRERSARDLISRHPDAAQIANDPSFGMWISESKIRTGMFEDARDNFNSEVAAELFDLWKGQQRAVTEQAANAKAQRSQAVASASTGTGKSSSETRGKPILSSERLIELKNTNPDRYYAQMEMIKQAYREGRVK